MQTFDEHAVALWKDEQAVGKGLHGCSVHLCF